MDKLLALDVGDRRIGVAVSDGLGITAQPVGMIERVGWGPDAKRVVELVAKHGASAVLCGLPRNMDGSYGLQAEKVRAFAERLEKEGLSVVFWDERLSTVTAERALIEGGVRRAGRRSVVDQTAATIILQAYLDANQQKSEGTGNMAHEEMENVVELIGEDGTPVNFEHLMTLDHKGHSYILLTPVEPETPDEEGSVVIMRIDKDKDGQDCYIVEEDEAVLETVFGKFLEAMEEEDEEEDEEE